MTNSQEECVPLEYGIWQLKNVSTQGEELTAATDASGILLVYGDSGFEGRTRFFVTNFTVRLSSASL